MAIELTVTVLRNDTDCTNGGVSSRTRRVILIGEFDEIPEDPILPVLRVKRRGKYVYCEPIDEVLKDHVGWMMGGNFVFTSDSRFRELVNGYPIAVHDRSETWEDYRLLSR